MPGGRGPRKPKPKLAAAELFELAVRSLARRAQSSSELRNRLRLRAAEEPAIDEVLTRLREYGYLNDRRFAETFVESRLSNQGFGRTRTLNDLRSRRVAGPVADAAVEQAYKETDELKLIEEYIRRKYRAVPREALFQSDKDLAGAYRRLLRAGFRGGNIVRILKKFAKNPELLDAIEDSDDDPARQAFPAN
jgi:regulatory protein